MDLSAGALIAALVFSTLGFALFVYGKKQARIPQLVAGVLLMVYPYFVGGALWISGIGIALLAAVWIAVRLGL